MMPSNVENDSKGKQPLIKGVLNVLRNSWVRAGIVGAALFFAVYYVFRQYGSIKTLLINGQIQINRIVFSNLFVFGVVSLGIALWWLTLSGFGIRLGILKAARIHILSTLAKYIPGAIWQISGKTYLSFSEGVPVKITGFGIAIEIGLSLLSGMGFALMLTPLVTLEFLPITHEVVILLQLVGVSLIVLIIASPWIIARVVKTTVKQHNLAASPFYWLGAVVVIVFAWAMLSASLYFSTSALGLPGLSFFECVLVICGSYVAGILVFFVPNGIVVREAVMVALLPIGYDSGGAILLSIFARVQVVFGEILLGLFILGVLGWQSRKSRMSNDQE